MKPDCYACQYRGSVPGSAHSCCQHPITMPVHADPFMTLASIVGKRGGNELMELAHRHGHGPGNAWRALGITAHQTGIDQGWFVWPVNFDPTWLETCNGFTPKVVTV